MADMLSDALGWLTGQLRDNASQPVTYRRGASSVVVNATASPKLLKLDDGQGGIRIEYTDEDFVFPVDELILDGDLVTPDRDDLIDMTRNGFAATFRVLPFGSDPPYRLIHADTAWRVHAKLIDTAQFYA